MLTSNTNSFGETYKVQYPAGEGQSYLALERGINHIQTPEMWLYVFVAICSNDTLCIAR